MSAIVVQNVMIFPKTAAKVAAAFLVITTLPVSVQNDVRRQPQAKVFSEPEVFAQAQRGSLTVVLTPTPPPYNQANDVRRRRQEKVFSEPEVFAQPQKSFVAINLTPAPIPGFVGYAARAVVIENVSIVKQQRTGFVVLGQLPPLVQSSDIFIGQDTYGWPPEPNEFFFPAQRPNPVVFNNFVAYNPATDVRRLSQAKVFSEPETFIQSQRNNYVINNTFAYNPATDVTRLKHQAIYFAEPETFVRPRAPLSVTLNFKAYVPGTDVRRAKQAVYFQDPETFPRVWTNNKLITEGVSGITPELPIPYPSKLDAYDYLNGSVLLAWAQLVKPSATSYNIYQQVYPSGAWVLIGAVPGTGPDYQFIANGLQITSYNPASQIITPSLTYQFKVVAVANGAECAETAIIVTPGPTSVALVTPMKRLWPFPSSGLS